MTAGWNRPPDDLAGWLSRHPGAEVYPDGPLRWRGCYPLGGSRLTCDPVPRGELLSAMVQLAADAAACLRVEADHPGWVAWVVLAGDWSAAREADGRIFRVRGGSPQELQEAIARAGAPATWAAS